MATLSFEGETNDELVAKVRRWLRSVDPSSERLGSSEAVERLAELVKDGLAVVAAAAPEPVAHSDLLQGLERMGYAATDQSSRAVVSGLNALAELSGDKLITRARRAGRTATYQMQRAVAAEVLRALRPR